MLGEYVSVQPQFRHPERRKADRRKTPVGNLGATSGPPALSELEAASSIKATVVLPAYNEAEALPEVLTSLFKVLDDSYEVIVVDDASSDDTSEIAKRFPCRLLRHERNQGKGAAVRTGLHAARGDFVIIMDADNTYPAEAVPQMVALSTEHDFVRCERQDGTTNSPLINRVGNKLFDYTLKIVHGLKGGDHLTGLYGLRRESLKAMNFDADGFDLEVEIGIKARAHRLRSASFPITYGARLGEKKLHALRDGWRILRKILAMALLYNPVLTFVVPGVILWNLAVILTLALGTGLIGASYGADSLPTLMVPSLGATVGFQLVVFGVAVALYSVERGVPPHSWLLTLGRSRVRSGAAVTGVLLSVVSLTIMTVLGSQWLVQGSAAFNRIGSFAIAGVLLFWGVQLFLAAMFVSVFAGHLERTTSVVSSREAQLRGSMFQVIGDLAPEPNPQRGVTS